MKIYLITALSICIASTATAQFITPAPLIFKQQPVAPKALLLSTAADHKVYALPQDNMPCLIPDITKISAIPNAITAFNNTMPNAMSLQNIIPINSNDGFSSAFNNKTNNNLHRFLTPAQIMPVPKKLTIQ